MRWKTSIEGSDEIPRGQRCEFEIEKNFEDLADGSVGLSIDDGKTILASLQRHLVQQQYSLYMAGDRGGQASLWDRDVAPKFYPGPDEWAAPMQSDDRHDARPGSGAASA